MLWYVAKETGFTNYSTYSNGATALTPDMWTVQAQSRHQPDGTNGAPTITDTFARVRIRLSMPAGGTGTFYICPMYMPARNRRERHASFDRASDRDDCCWVVDA